jgi:hypothetical protein
MQHAADRVHAPVGRFFDALRPEQQQKHAAAPSKPERDLTDQQRASVFCSLLVPPERVGATTHQVMRAIRPQGHQAALFNDVMAAAVRSQQLLHESCTIERTGDALKQLDMMRKRLQITAEAIGMMHAAVSRLAESLEGRQRRSFARLGFGAGAQAQASR